MIAANSTSAWSTSQVLGQGGLHRESLFQKLKKQGGVGGCDRKGKKGGMKRERIGKKEADGKGQQMEGHCGHMNVGSFEGST